MTVARWTTHLAARRTPPSAAPRNGCHSLLGFSVFSSSLQSLQLGLSTVDRRSIRCRQLHCLVAPASYGAPRDSLRESGSGLAVCREKKAKTPGQAADPPSILVHARGPRTALLSATPPCCTTPLRHIQPWVASHPPTPTPTGAKTAAHDSSAAAASEYSCLPFPSPLQQQAPCVVAPSRLSASPSVHLDALALADPAPITGSLSLGSVQPSATGPNLPGGVDVVATPQLPQRALSS